jgi:hypothetical protein
MQIAVIVMKYKRKNMSGAVLRKSDKKPLKETYSQANNLDENMMHTAILTNVTA